MPVQCAKCGEELLGSVNRCWRCGSAFVSRPGSPSEPAIRRRPPAVPLPVPPHDQRESASSSEDQQQRRSAAAAPIPPGAKPAAEPTAWHGSDQQPVTAQAISEGRLRVGAPFATAASGAVIASLVIGILAFCFSFFTITALIVAVLGIAMGVWGLYSDRRGMALLGILLCCGAIAISGVNGAVAFYERIHGVSPWDEASGALDRFD